MRARGNDEIGGTRVRILGRGNLGKPGGRSDCIGGLSAELRVGGLAQRCRCGLTFASLQSYNVGHIDDSSRA